MANVELFNDHFQNFKKYLNCKAQLIIADPPYNLGKNAYASNPQWYIDGEGIYTDSITHWQSIVLPKKEKK